MWHTDIQPRPPLPPGRVPARELPRRAMRLRPRVSLRTGEVLALQVGGGLSPVVHAALECWPATVNLCVPALSCAPTLPRALDVLLRAQRARVFGARTLEVMLPAGVMDAGPDVLLLLSALVDEGVGLVLDCTSTGLPSGAALARLPLTGLLLDAGTATPPRTDKAACQHLRTLLRTCAELGVAVLADSVETEAQRAVLSILGCEQGSGDLFGPAPAVDAVRPAALH